MVDYRASELPRVIECSGSKAMAGQVPAIVDDQTEDAREGIAAHWLATKILTADYAASAFDFINTTTPSGFYISDEMAEHVDTFVTAVTSRPGIGTRYVEHPVDWEYTAGAFIRCRPDHIHYDETNRILYVDDFKFGWRLVDAESNWTLIAYAIGFVQQRNIMPDQIVMTIHQPRRHHPDGRERSWPINMAALVAYYEFIKSELTSLNTALTSGDHCHLCPARGYCPALREAGYNAIDTVATTVASEELPDTELTYELALLEVASKRLEDRLTAVREIAMHRIQSGRALGDYIIEPSYGHRKFNEGITPELLAAITGVDVYAPPKLITPAQLEKRGVSKKAVAALASAPFTGFRLVRHNADKKARKLFNK